MRAGIVLAGGSGRRLGGVDKAMVEVGGISMLDRVLAALQPHCDEVIVVGPNRETGASGVRFTIEDEPGGGPVPGVAAGLAEVPDADTVILLAVDLPLLTPDDIARLLETLAGGDASAVAAADHRGKPNPLLAAYTAEPLRRVVASFGPDTPAARLLPTDTEIVDLGEAGTLNVNSADDLERARAVCR